MTKMHQQAAGGMPDMSSGGGFPSGAAGARAGGSAAGPKVEEVD
jgi:hypothetical protein